MSAAEAFDAGAYLARLGVAAGPPTLAQLFAIHRAHVERVAYTSLDFHAGIRHDIDQYESAARVAGGGRAGYCYHLNGALAALLDQLGYDVRRHVAGVQMRGDAQPPGPNGNHLALTVTGLPDAPDGTWLVDAGLGDALYEPLPLAEGEYVQGPFQYRLRPSEVSPGGWRFDHDPSGSFAGMDFGLAPATMAAFAERHAYLSTSPESGFVQLLVAQRRDATGVDALRGRVLRRLGAGASERELADEADFVGVLGDTFGLRLDDVDTTALWRRVRIAHAAWRRSLHSPLSHQDELSHQDGLSRADVPA